MILIDWPFLTSTAIPLRAGMVSNGNLRAIWQESEVARLFRQASIARRPLAADDPFLFILGGGDIEHSYFWSLDGSGRGDLDAPDPYYGVYAAMARDVMLDLADSKRGAFNRRSGFDSPILFHHMGVSVDGCHTRYLLEVRHCAMVYTACRAYSASIFSHRIFCLADGLTSSRARNAASTSLISSSGSWGKSEA